MAYLKSAAILTRIREVLEDSEGFRAVPAGRFFGDLPEGLSDDAEELRALDRPRVEATITAVRRSPASPAPPSTLKILELDVSVRVVRLIEPLEQLDDAQRIALQALAVDDCDVISQALEYPSNLLATEAGAVTDLVGGLLRYQSSAIEVVGSVDDGAQILSTVHSFSGHAISRPATS